MPLRMNGSRRLGRLRTSVAGQTDRMSALPPIATELVQRSELPLCAKTGRERSQLFNYPVGARQQRRGQCEAERLDSFQVDQEFELGRLINWDVARFGPF